MFQLNIAVCDDEKYYRTHIKKLLTEYLQKEDVFFQIGEFSDGKDFCEEESNFWKYDIIFLDIEMGSMNGMETAHTIRAKNKKMDIVFITVMQDYVFEGYRVGAARYIMKTDLEVLLPECLEALLKSEKYCGQQMEFSFIGGKRKLFLKDLLYIESDSHRLNFVKEEEVLHLYGKISELERKLSDYNFIRCHQSFLVNPEHIDRIKNY